MCVEKFAKEQVCEIHDIKKKSVKKSAVNQYGLRMTTLFMWKFLWYTDNQSVDDLSFYSLQSSFMSQLLLW